MKHLSAGLIASALVLFAITPPPVHAELNPQTDSPHPFRYDVSEEVTLSGTVTSVLAKPAPGMIMGTHALLTTPSGSLDISLGNAALTGRDAVDIQAGQPIEVTGVKKIIRHKEVFLARVVKANGHTYQIRSEHGFLAGKPGRETTSARKGDLL